MYARIRLTSSSVRLRTRVLGSMLVWLHTARAALGPTP